MAEGERQAIANEQRLAAYSPEPYKTQPPANLRRGLNRKVWGLLLTGVLSTARCEN